MEAWNNRKLDYRNKDDILEEMRRLGTSYTPEWYFDEKSDDAEIKTSIEYITLLRFI